MKRRSCCSRILLAIVSLSILSAANAIAVVAAPIVDFDIQACVDRQIASGAATITIPPGRYRVKPRNGQHLLVANLKNVQIVADGVEMICTENVRALTVANCCDTTIRGLVIDYDPLPFTQGKIVKMSNDHKGYEVELFDGYPDATTACTFKFEVFRSDTRELRYGGHSAAKLEVVNRRRLRVTNVGHDIKDVNIGDLIVTGVNYAPWAAIAQDVDKYSWRHHAVVCDCDVNVRLENIVVYASYWFAFFERNCDGNVYTQCRLDRRPAGNDIVKRGSARLRSGNSDAFHCTRAGKGPSYIQCIGKFMGDDGVNIQGDYHMITECHGDQLRVLARDDLNVAVGDPVEIFTFDGKRLPDAKVLKVESDGKINEIEKAFLRKQNIREIYRIRWNADAWRISLDRKVDVPVGSMIVSMNHEGNGFLIKNCEFGFNRTRSLLIRGSNGAIIGNKLVENGLPAILITSECFWLEGGNPRNVEVRANHVVNCRTTAICVAGSGGLLPGNRAAVGTYRNISIVDNMATGCPLPNISVSSIEGGRIENNIFESLQGTGVSKNPTTRQAVRVINCLDICEKNNILQ